MNNFNWGNYIGPHMSEPLRVGFVSGNDNYVADLTGIEIDGLKQLKLFLWDGGSWHCKADQCKPLIKSISDLTDEELQYIFGVDFKVNRKEHLVYLRECRINLKTGYIQPCDQQILNRLYSLHCHPNADKLIKNNQAVKK